MTDLTITDLQRDSEGYWEAIIQAGDQIALVNRRWGSWQIDNPRTEVDPMVAAVLQSKVRKLEKAEKCSA